MGGMFSVVKVREGLAADDYKDPGPFRHPAGTVAYEVAGNAAEAPQAPVKASSRPAALEVQVIKPNSKKASPHQH
jgi:hypothetical protein